MIMSNNRVELWLCLVCGKAHLVPASKLGRIGTCRRCQTSDVIVNHTDDKPALARARELRRAWKNTHKSPNGK